MTPAISSAAAAFPADEPGDSIAPRDHLVRPGMFKLLARDAVDQGLHLIIQKIR
jgi:hypothetical protein